MFRIPLVCITPSAFAVTLALYCVIHRDPRFFFFFHVIRYRNVCRTRTCLQVRSCTATTSQKTGPRLYNCCRNLLTSPSLSAPIKWLIGFPSLKAITVGSDRICETCSTVKRRRQCERPTRYFWASSNSLSVSMVTKSRERPLPVLVLTS